MANPPKSTAQEALDRQLSAAPETQERPESKEKKEKPKKKPSIHEYQDKAEKVKLDPNVEAAEHIHDLSGAKEVHEQYEGLTAFNTAIVGVLAKLSKKGVDISKINNHRELQKAINEAGIQGELSLPEKAAVENLNRLANESGPTSQFIRQNWQETLDTSQEASKGIPTKAWEYAKKRPGAALAIVAAGALGLYASYNFVRWALHDEEKDEKEGKSSHFGKKALAAAALSVLSLFLGREYVLKMLAAHGLDLDNIRNELREHGGELSDKTKKKLEQAGPDAKAAVEEMQEEYRRKHGGGGTTGKAESAEGGGEGAPSIGREEQERREAARRAREKAKEDAETMLEHQLPQDLLIELFCYNRYEYSESDVLQIRNSMDKFRGKSLADVLKVWEEYKDKGAIPLENSLGKFEDGIEEKNVYMAVKIIALTAQEFKKHSRHLDFEKTTVKQFLDEMIAKDPARKITHAVQETIISTISNANLTDLMKLNDLDFKGIEMRLEEIGVKAWEDLAIEFGINLKEINKADFVLMLAHLQHNATLKMDAEKAFGLADFPKSDEKTMAAMKVFYERIRERTKQQIIPAAVERFNIGKDIASEDANADIIKNYLNDGISFKRGLYLNLVTRSIDLSKPAKEGSSAPQELAFLFTVLSSIPKEQKARYISELTVLMLKYPDKLPSLAIIQPYFTKVADFAVEHVKNKAKAASYWLSALMPNRSPAEQEAFLDEIRDKSWVKWGGEMGIEIAGGALAVAKEFIVPFVDSGKVTLEQIGDCEDVWDFMLLVKDAGGTFLYTKDENGEPHGMIHFMGDTFVFRPLGIVKETFEAALEGDLGGAFKVWTVGSAPFVAYGAMHGWFMARIGHHGWLPLVRAAGTAKGALRGLAYPYYALRTSWRAARYTASAAMNLPTAVSEYTSRPAQRLRRLGRGAEDFIRYRTPWPGQNVPNMLDNGRRFQHYFRGSDLSDLSLREKIHNLTNDPKLLLRRLNSTFNNRMTLRYASRFAQDYNDFFKFDKASSQKLVVGEILQGNEVEIGKAINRYSRMREFLEGVPKYKSIFEEMKAAINSGLKGDDLRNALSKSIQRMQSIEPDEARALAKQLLSEKDVLRLEDRMTRGLNLFSEAAKATAPAKRASLASRLRERLRRSTGAEKVRSFGKAERALKRTQSQIAAIDKRVSAAQKELGLLDRMRKGPKFDPLDKKLQARLESARKIIADGKEAKAALENSAEALRKVREAEKRLAGVSDVTSSEGSRLLVELQAAEEAAEDAWKLSKSASEGLGKLGKLGTTLKWAGRGLGVAGALFSYYETGSSAYEAVTTDVEGRGAIKGAEAGLWALNAAADTAAVAVMFGATGTAATAASYAALPLLPLTYAGTTVAETLYEETVTDYEWVQKNPYELLHHFYTSVNSCSLGDAWTTVGIESQIERSLEAKTETMHKIYRGLVAIQKDPTLLEYIATEPPSGKKDKEIERRIAENYSVYHEYYFRNTVPTGIQSYSSAQKFVLEAQMYDDIMTQRDKAKEEGREFVIRGKNFFFNLHLDRYDIVGGMDDPKARTLYMPDQVVKAYKESVMSVFEQDPILAANLERMNTQYLLRLYVQMNLAINDEAMKAEFEKEPGLKQALALQMICIKNYLKAGRNLNFEFDVRQPENFQPRMSLKAIKEALEGMSSLSNEAYLKYETDNFTITPALHALYKLGQYFGYNGPPSEIKLKEFFNADGASYRGLYWDGSEWRLQERGLEIDDSFGPALTTETVRRLAQRMRQQPDNILEHRSDTIFVDAYDYEAEVKRMAQILEDGITEGYERGYKRSQEELQQKEVAPPEKFDPQNIDYSKEKEPLKADLRKAIEHVKAATGWTQLNYKVIDERTVELTRANSAANVRLSRQGKKWNVGGYFGNLEFTQAVSLGNLKNFAEEWLTQNKFSGEDSNPFQEVADGRIQFQVSWGFDRDFLRNEGWINFYEEIGVTKQDALTVLNNWYAATHG